MRDPKAIVKEGYDKISLNYRSETFDFEKSGYHKFLSELDVYLDQRSRFLDLGCGCGIPVAQYLAQKHDVTGVDLSEVQVTRARALVPQARFVCADMMDLTFPANSFDAIVSFYAIIHLPVEQQPGLFEQITKWLLPGGYLMATVGNRAWTGTEADWKGAEMYWSQADVETYRNWLEQYRFVILAEHFIPEGEGGHSLFIAKKATQPSAP